MVGAALSVGLFRCRIPAPSVPIPSRLVVLGGSGGRIVRERVKREPSLRCYSLGRGGEGIGKDAPSSPYRRLSIAKAVLSPVLEDVDCSRACMPMLDLRTHLSHHLQPPNFRRWSSITETLVSLSTVAFLFLLVPQLAKNTLGILTGNVQAMAILSWRGYAMALLGNSLLLSYFLDRSERSASMVQVVGVVSNAAMLSQIFFAGFMPLPAYLCSAAMVAASSLMSGCKLSGILTRSPNGWEVWRSWRDIMGLIGVAAVPQALCSTCFATRSPLPCLVGAVVAVTLLALDRMRSLPDGLSQIWAATPGWSATLLFAFQPLAQLANNVADPGSLAGISVGSLMLGMLGNGLMVPRGLLTGDGLWAVGSAWACVTSWAQLLTLALGRSASGVPYVPHPVFALTTLGLLAYASIVLKCDAHAKGLLSPWTSVHYLLTGTMDSVSMDET